MEHVDYLIIGSGMAGLTLKRFLKNDRTAVVDPEPGRYKIGESIIPELFYNLEVRKLIPDIRKLKSYTKKHGSIFMTETEVASFPLPPELADIAMHIERPEFERLMMRKWNIPVREERVLEINMEDKHVRTDKNTYQVKKQILDCSGPAMVVASHLHERSEILPAHAIWTYYDIQDIRDEAFYDEIAEHGKTYMRFDVPKGRLLPEKEESPGWKPSQTTILMQVQEGMWMWQIPLFDSTRLSVGIVSRKGKLTREEFLDLVKRHHSPHYTLSLRTIDNSSPYNRVHRRDHLAQKARVASTPDYVLIADAFAFADPIYSVGTGLAVNKAIQVAALLNNGGWSEKKSLFYNTRYDELIAAAIEGFNFWYSVAILKNDSIASHVQKQFLSGKAFSIGISRHYGQQIQSAMGDKEADYEHWPKLYTWEQTQALQQSHG